MSTLADIVKSHADQKISSNDTLAQPLEFEKSGTRSEKLYGAEITIGGSATGRLSLVNRNTEAEKPNDPENIFFDPTLDDATLAELLKPSKVIDLPKNTGYLRYEVGISIDGQLGLSKDLYGLSIKGNRAASLSYYSPHPFKSNGKVATLGQAVTKDLIGRSVNVSDLSLSIESIRTLFGDSDAEEMKTGQILSLRSTGSLKAKAEIDAADILAGSVTASGLFDSIIPISFEGGLTASADIDFSDDFQTIVYRANADRYLVVIRKSKTRGSTASLNAGVDAQIDLTQLVAAMNAALARLGSSTATKVQNLRAKLETYVNAAQQSIPENPFAATELKTLSALYDRLVEEADGKLVEWAKEGDEKIADALESLNGKLQKWQSAIGEYSNLALSATLSLEFGKLSTEMDLIRFECSKDALKRHRKHLLLMNLKPVLDEIAALETTQPKKKNRAIELIRFMRAEKLAETRSWGATLNFGKWSFGLKRSSSASWITVEDVRKRQILKASFYGDRAYHSRFAGKKFDYRLSFSAASAQEAAGEQPTLQEMEYSIDAVSQFQDGKLTEDKLLQLIDWAIVTGALPMGDPADYATRILKTDPELIGQPATAKIGISLKGDAAIAAIGWIANASLSDFSKALALSMPWKSDRETRRQPQARQSAYRDIWTAYLERKYGNSRQKYVSALNDSLEAQGLRSLAKAEVAAAAKRATGPAGKRKGSRKSASWSFAGLIDLHQQANGTIPGDIAKFRNGFGALNRALVQGPARSYREFESVFDQVKQAWDFSFSARWVAAILKAAISGSFAGPPTTGEFENRFQIETGKESAKRSIAFPASHPPRAID